MTRRNGFSLVVSTVALAIVMGVSPVRADSFLGTLEIGTNSNGGGGSFDQAYWTSPNGGQKKSLRFLYCISLLDTISLGGVYNNTTATTDGQVVQTRIDSSKTLQYVGYKVPTSTAIAGSIAYLLQTHGEPFGYGAHGNNVQEAIWKLVYGDELSNHWNGTLSATSASWVEEAITHSADGKIGNYLWFTPGKLGSTTVYQAQVGQVPDGGVTLILLGGALVGLETLRRRFRA